MAWVQMPLYKIQPTTNFERQIAEHDAIVMTYEALAKIEAHYEHCHASRQGLPDHFRPDHIHGVPFYVYPLDSQCQSMARELKDKGKRVLLLDSDRVQIERE